LKNGILFEACVGSADAAVAAQTGGADRVELCADLLEGGTTPSAGTIRVALERLSIPVHVIVRPRGGDFCHSELELEAMRRDIETCKQLGVHGVVFGLLREDGAIDVERTAELVALARPMAVTFHRAFDVCRDPFEALEQLIELGIERVLTSGQEPTVLEGADLIAELVQRAGERIVVMPGAGFTERNIRKIVEQARPREVHVAAWGEAPSRMQHRNPRVFMGGELRPPEYSIATTDPARMRAFLDALG